MSPFSGNRAEFMTVDALDYKRNDGWFLSYPKVAAAIVVFIIGVLAAGFLGWYIHTSPRKKGYDTLDIINEDIAEDAIVASSILPYIHPVEYHLDLSPVIEANTVSKIKGRVLIEFRVGDTTGLSKLTLNAKNISVVGHKLLTILPEEVGVQSRRRRNTKKYHSSEGREAYENIAAETATPIEISKRDLNDIGIAEYKEDEHKELHTAYLTRPIKEGTYILEIDYECLVTEDIVYQSTYSNLVDKWLMGLKLNPFNVRSFFPLFEDAQVKTPFSISIARPKEMRVLSNMPIRISKESNHDEIVDIFAESPPFSTHNLAFVMGNIETIGDILVMNSSNVHATFWDAPGRHMQGTYLIHRLDSTIINLINIFSMPHPFAKVDIVGLPAGVNENIGKPGLISIKRSEWSTSKESSSILKTQALRSLIYLLGKQWLEGVVNMNQTDVWVHESSLLYLQYALLDKIDPSLESSNSFLVDILFDAMETDGYSVYRSLHTSVNHIHTDSFHDEYMKGACLVRMLHSVIGDASFRNGFKEFIDKWKYQTTNAVEFFKAMSANTSEVLPNVSLDEVMNSWILQSGYPILFVMRDYEAGTIKIHQAQFTYDTLLGESEKLWHIPLTYANDSSGWTSPGVTWLAYVREMTIEDFGRNESWILFNVNKTGYYRVHYDESNWDYLSAALREDHESFPPETRASLIDDVFSLAAIGLTTYERAFEFIKYMQMKERHYAPWGVFMKHAFKLNRLLYETSVFTEYQEFILDFISPLYTEFGMVSENSTELALISLKMACEFEHSECVDKAKEIFANIQTDPHAKENIPVHVRSTFYCTIARYGTRKEWSYFVENATANPDKEERERVLTAMSCFQAPWALQAILIEIVHGTSFHEDEIPVILQSFPRNPAAAQVASRFVRSNWQDILKRFSDSYTILKSFILSMLNGLTTEEDTEDLQEFRDENFDDLKGGKYATAVLEANANFVTSWLDSSLPEIELLLSKNVTNTDSEMLT